MSLEDLVLFYNILIEDDHKKMNITSLFKLILNLTTKETQKNLLDLFKVKEFAPLGAESV
ncbi:hypothetical protein [Chryseobacterium sp. VD8]|uniref:hypothetical protein n=1 Tax=Chryseobacterium sp. VD8 TaxID=3081254 RepID=UPI00301757C6